MWLLRTWNVANPTWHVQSSTVFKDLVQNVNINHSKIFKLTFLYNGLIKYITKIQFSSFQLLAAATAKSLQLCLTLCDPIDGSPPGSPIPGILQAKTPEWVAISLSNAWKWKLKVKSLSCVRLSAIPWTAAYQAPLSMGFSRQEFWSGMPYIRPHGLPSMPGFTLPQFQ